jgi:hypothetical protein
MKEYESGFIVYSPLEMAKYIRNNSRFKVVFRPIEEVDFDAACLIARKKGNLNLHLEEINNYCSPHGIRDELRKCHLQGRHARLNIFYTTQRFSECHRSVTAMTDYFALFRTCEPIDIDAIEKRFGYHVAERVRKLDDLQYVKVSQRRKDESDFSVGCLGFDRGVVYHRCIPSDSAEGTAERPVTGSR